MDTNIAESVDTLYTSESICKLQKYGDKIPKIVIENLNIFSGEITMNNHKIKDSFNQSSFGQNTTIQSSYTSNSVEGKNKSIENLITDLKKEIDDIQNQTDKKYANDLYDKLCQALENKDKEEVKSVGKLLNSLLTKSSALASILQLFI